jgi:two-component system sensor histidine kinase HydH
MVSALERDIFEPSPRAHRAHAMKNCVGIIYALSRLEEASQRRWEHLRAAALRLRELLVEDLAQESRNAPAAPRPSLESCNVEALVRSVVERLEPGAAEAGVEVLVSCGGGAIEADEVAVGEALFNIVINAIEATPHGGRVSLSTRQLDNGDQHWVLEDTGHGIPNHHLDQLGRPGWSRKKGGAGMGFAVARAILARHGGTLHVESDGCSGTTITMRLPNHHRGPALEESVPRRQRERRRTDRASRK